MEFEVRDGSDGGTQPAQHFSMLIDDSRKGIFQASRRVPTYAGSSQYIDVGANVECTVREADGKALLSASIELTDITGYVNLSAISEPIIRQRKAVFHATVELGTRTLVMGRVGAVAPVVAASIRHVEATVTKLN